MVAKPAALLLLASAVACASGLLRIHAMFEDWHPVGTVDAPAATTKLRLLRQPERRPAAAAATVAVVAPRGRVLCLDPCSGTSSGGCPRPKRGRTLRSQTKDWRDGGDTIAADAKDAKSTPPYPPIDQSMCAPAAEWQKTFHPKCNTFHEIDFSGGVRNGLHRERKTMATIEGLGSGKWRSAWMLSWPVGNGKGSSIVLKTLNLLPRVQFDSLTYDRNQIDAAITDHLSPSAYVVGIYGFCGQSVLNELADKSLNDEMKSLWDDAIKAGEELEGTLQEKAAAASQRWGESFVYRLELASGAARALAYAQGVDSPEVGHPTIAHNDLRPANYILSGGSRGGGRQQEKRGVQVKLNDFNAGELVFRNATQGHHRGSEVGDRPCLFRRYPPMSPYKSSPERARGLPLLPAADVYALGSVLYGLLVGRMPYSGVPAKKAWEMVKEGKHTAVPDAYAKSDDPAVRTVLRLAEGCWATDPWERPNAAEVAMELEGVVNDARKRMGRLKKKI